MTLLFLKRYDHSREWDILESLLVLGGWLALVVVFGLLFTAIARSGRGHQHEWVYHPRSIGGTGWGVCECSTCGASDIY